MAAYSGLKSDFIERTSKAYSRFQREKVPFSALRLGISGSDVNDHDVDQVVGQHLRETDEVLGQGDNSYAILMQGTSFDSAIEASKRLANGLLNLKKANLTTAPGTQWNASFEIIGCRKGSDGICRTFLELNNHLVDVREKKPIPKQIRTYIQNSEVMTQQAIKPRQTVNIVV